MQPSGGEQFQRLLEEQATLILDGGLATALEALGYDLADPLWSARILLEDPEAIQRVHGDYLAAGADCIITSSYQASIQGFQARGLDEAKATELIQLSSELAVEARDSFWSVEENRAGRLRPLVAASVGPYGAALADGSEYSGDYGVTDDTLYEFHASRWRLLAGGPSDLIACETIPSAQEAAVLLQLLGESSEIRAWMSFSCRDGERIHDGSEIREVLERCDSTAALVAVGINCTAPEHVPSLIRNARAATTKPIVVYPNSGELFDARSKRWRESPSPVDWAIEAKRWRDLGASAVGGCCRVGCEEIAVIRASLV
jgi:homocysteine S-methyltransferase